MPRGTERKLPPGFGGKVKRIDEQVKASRAALEILDKEVPFSPSAESILEAASKIAVGTAKLAGANPPRDAEELANWVDEVREARKFLNALTLQSREPNRDG